MGTAKSLSIPGYKMSKQLPFNALYNIKSQMFVLTKIFGNIAKQ